jgi:hypothetical protein
MVVGWQTILITVRRCPDYVHPPIESLIDGIEPYFMGKKKRRKRPPKKTRKGKRLPARLDEVVADIVKTVGNKKWGHLKKDFEEDQSGPPR